jgi:hypothetical protein
MLQLETAQVMFRHLVQRAMRAQGVQSSEDTEYYLVQLLMRFVRPRRRNLLDPPLGIEFLTALQLPPHQRRDRLRHVADSALFLTGLFVEYLERTLVGPAYYVNLGRSAYARLSAEGASTPMAPSFDELAQRFPDFVRVLSDIAQCEMFPRERDVLRVYKRWLLTRGEQDAVFLAKQGLIPWAPPTQRRH